MSEEKTTMSVWACTVFAAIGGFLFGYDSGVVSGAVLLIKDEFEVNSIMHGVIVSMSTCGAFLAAISSSLLNDRFGRKFVIMVSSSSFMTGAIVLGAAQHVWMLIVGRVLVGIGIGFVATTISMYTAECAPAHIRGRLVTVSTIFVTGGMFFGSAMAGAFSYDKYNGWRWMFGIAGLAAATQFIGFFFLPESPRWLMSRGDESRAREVLTRLRGSEAVNSELGEMRADVEAERRSANSGELGLVRIIKTPPVRRALVLGCGLMFFQQLGGINLIMFYSATIISMSGVSDQHSAIWLASLTIFANLIGASVGLWLVEKIGRKPLVMSSLAGVIFSLSFLAVAFQLAAINSPNTRYDNNYNSSNTCNEYRTCEACIEDSHCGFCFTGQASSANGTCLPTDPSDALFSSYGECSGNSNHTDVNWAENYCPSDFSSMAVIGLILYLLCFSAGMGPMPWTINSEIYPLWARSTGNGVAMATGYIVSFLVSMMFLPLTDVITKYGTFWMLAGCATIGLAFFAVALPETKGKKLEEVEELFEKPYCSLCGS